MSEQPPGTFLLCPICYWEDDPVQFYDPDYPRGMNRHSLRQAQANFHLFGASGKYEAQFVRKPTADDERDPHWKPLE